MWSYFGLWQIPVMKCQQCLHRSLPITDSAKLTLSSTAARTEQSCCVLLPRIGLVEKKETGMEVLPNANLEGRDPVKLTTLCDKLNKIWVAWELSWTEFSRHTWWGQRHNCPEFCNGSLNQNHSYLPGSTLPLHMWCPDLSASVG